MELTNEQKEQVRNKFEEFLNDIFFNVLHVDFNDDVAYNHSLEYDFAETLGKVESHIERCLDETIPLNNEGGS